jgi:hypothetical protein
MEMYDYLQKCCASYCTVQYGEAGVASAKQVPKKSDAAL